MFLLLLMFPMLVVSKDEMASRSSVIHHIVLNNSDIGAMLESLPEECTKNGKKYNEGEQFTIGNLRYKCQKYGVYSIEALKNQQSKKNKTNHRSIIQARIYAVLKRWSYGCVTTNGTKLKIGEVIVKNNVKAQCLASGNSVFYRETVCGILGQPECDKIGPPSRFAEAVMKEKARQPQKEVAVPGLPPGWKLVNESLQGIPGTDGARIISRVLTFNPFTSGIRFRRQSQRGLPMVVEISEDVGTDKPPMPLKMLLSGGKRQNGTKTHTTTKKPKFVHSTQQVSRKLEIKDNRNERLVGVGTGSQDLKGRTKTISNTKGLKPESVSGWRSSVGWKGEKELRNGRTIAVGPGTFTIGISPTGTVMGRGNGP